MSRRAPEPVPALVDVLARAVAEATDPPDGTVERILDAALAEVAQRGTTATTMDDIAARAKVARMTVFRRFGSKTALLERLMLREVRAFLAHVDTTLAAIEDPADRVAEAFVLCVRTAADHPLVARLARHEPGATLESLSAGEPSPLDVGRAYVATTIRADHPSARVRDDADAIADVLVRLALTYVLVPGAIVDLSDDDAARTFARRVLAPLVA